MKCKTSRCDSRCCYNVPFANGELERFRDRIVNKVVRTIEVNGGMMPVTNNHVGFVRMMMSNRCPFLRKDHKCNIYDDRPDVCRKFGEIPELPCEYRR